MTCVCARSSRVLAALPRRSEDPAAMGAAASQEAGDFRRSSIQVHLHAAAGRERVFGTGPPAAQGPLRALQHTLQVRDAAHACRWRRRSERDPCRSALRSRRRSALPVRRLWHYLVKQEEIQETFIRNIFTKKRDLNEVFQSHRMPPAHRQLLDFTPPVMSVYPLMSLIFVSYMW